MLAAIDRVLAALSWLAAALVVLALLVGPELVGAKDSGPPKGPIVFSSAGCGACHTLAASRTTGTSGPNLDRARPDAAAVAAIVERGSGPMPSFSDSLSRAEIRAVAEYVAAAAGR